MFSFFKKKKDTPAPAWASFFSAEEYRRFVLAVEDYFKSNNIEATVHDGIVEGAEAFGGGQLGLSNLAQMCRGMEPGLWAQQIAGHFETMRRNVQTQKEFETRSADFEYAKDFIGVRLFNTEVLQRDTDSFFIRRPLLKDVFSMLCFDLPDSVINVKPEQAAKWPDKTEDELFALGMENIRQKYPLQLAHERIGESLMWVTAGEHFFMPNILFDLDRHPQLNSPHGMLIGVPTRHVALIYPINDLSVVGAVTTMTQVIRGMYQEGPGSLSGSLYWYRNGQFEDQPFDTAGGKVQFRPTGNFTDMMNTLQAPQGEMSNG